MQVPETWQKDNCSVKRTLECFSFLPVQKSSSFNDLTKCTAETFQSNLHGIKNQRQISYIPLVHSNWYHSNQLTKQLFTSLRGRYLFYNLHLIKFLKVTYFNNGTQCSIYISVKIILHRSSVGLVILPSSVFKPVFVLHLCMEIGICTKKRASFSSGPPTATSFGKPRHLNST